MKSLFFFRKVVVTTTFSILFVLGGCSKYDDSALWDEVRKQADRIAALETWQAQVNTNVQSLQQLVNVLSAGDMITGVTPFETPAPGGYKITFRTASEITVYNGTNGVPGTPGAQGAPGTPGTPGSTPQIGVAEYPAGTGQYYWTLNGEFILAGGDKLPVNGGSADIALKLRINETSGEWEVSYDNGQTWNTLGVNANSSGGGIFNAVNDSHPDYVVFTLAAGGQLQVAKYKAFEFVFEQPEGFDANEMKTVNFTAAVPVDIVTVINNTQPDWKITVDITGNNSGSIDITAPAVFNGANDDGEAIIMASDGDGRTVLRKVQFSKAAFVVIECAKPFARWNEDPDIPYAAYNNNSYPIEKLWDGLLSLTTLNIWLTGNRSSLPTHFTFDLGDTYYISSITVWQRINNGVTHAYEAPELFRIFGSASPDARLANDDDESMNPMDDRKWKLLVNCQSSKPSGLPLLQASEEDIQLAARDGQNFTVPTEQSKIPVRYIRFTMDKAWDDNANNRCCLAEMSFFGQKVK